MTEQPPASRHDLIKPGHAATEPTLAELMSRVGERIPFSVSVGISAFSVVTLALLLTFAPAHWRLALLLVSCGCFGAWTLADHERRADGAGRSARWRFVQGASGALGMTSVFVLLLAYLASALGLWIS